MKHDPEVKIFYQDRNCYISEENVTSHVAVNFLNETNILLLNQYYHLVMALWRYSTQKNTLWGNRFY